MGIFDLGLSDLAGPIIGGAFDLFSSSQANKANKQASAANVAAQGANQDKALASLTGTSDFQSTLPNGSGGFDVSQPGGGDAATARSALSFGDVGRAGNINDATGNFNFTLPTLADAQGVINRDNALQDTGIIQPGLDKIALLQKRQFGGINNSAEPGSTVGALAQFAAQNKLGGEKQALDLFQKAGQNDNALLSQLINNNRSLAPAPSFSANGPGATAANVIAQSPPPQGVVDLGGALFPAAGSNVISQLQTQAANQDSQKNLLATIRQLGNSGAFGTP